MKVKLAKTAGFCMGVRRAINIVLDEAHKKKGKLYTYGPLVHNPQTIEMLKHKGVEILKKENNVSDSTIIIRAHGVPPEERAKLKESGNLVCDATCPHVARAHAIIKKEVKEGYKAIIIGDRGHAEVDGLLGYAKENGFVVENAADIDNLPEMDKVCVVAQTTQDRKNFQEIVEKIQTKFSDTRIFDTICDSTNMRQKEALELAKEVDAMVIVGGKNSANTKRLYEISLSTGTPSFHIEDDDELDHLGLEKFENIGLMAGASTPNWVITKVIDRIKYLLKKQRGRMFRTIESICTFFLESSLYLSLGAVSMYYAIHALQGFKPSTTMMYIVFFYIFAMHTFNRYYERSKNEFSEPARTRFFKSYGKALIAAAFIASLSTLYFSYLLGLKTFFLLLFSYLMGIIYSVRIIPLKPLSFIKYKRLKDIPGSKDIFVSVAWAWIIVLIPMFNHDIYFSYESMSVLAFTLVTVFMRSVVFDVVRIEGDRIVGRETIPIVIGTKHTRTILLFFTLMISIYLILSSMFGLIPSLGYYLIISPIFIIFCLYLFHKQRMQPSRLFEAVIDSNFILTGLIAYVWLSIH